MSLEFAPGWNIQKPAYVAQHGAYQQLLNLLSQSDVKMALSVASLLYREGKIGDAVAAACKPAGSRVVVEQGAHQKEAIKDSPVKASIRKFDMVQNETLHFTLRHYRADAGPNGVAFHCYLARNSRKQWGITSISFFQGNAGLQMGQTGARDFMAQLAKNYVLAHGYGDD